jgi:small redox-active disulfide protein 2
MKKIIILGTGCAKCEKLAGVAKEAAESAGIEYQLDKIQDIQEIMKYGVMMTPALVIDGVVRTVGKIPAIDEIKSMLKNDKE